MPENELAIILKARDEFSGVLRTQGQAVQGLSNRLQTLSQRTSTAGERLRGFGRMARTELPGALKVGAVAAVGALGMSLGRAVSKIGAFEDAMRATNAMARLSEEQFQELSRQVIGLSKQVPISATELAQGLFLLVSAGVPVQESMEALTTTARVATAGQATMEDAVAGLTAVMKGYGMSFDEAAHVADVFFKVNELGQTTVGQVAASIQRVAPIAAQTGVSVEELAGAYATLTGVTGDASEVAVQLRGILASVLKPTTDQVKTARQLGLEFGASAIEGKGFVQFMREVGEAVGDDQEAMARLFPRVEALPAVMALSGVQLGSFAQKTEAMTGASQGAGAAQEAFREQMKSTGAEMAVLRNRTDATAYELSGFTKTVLDGMQPFLSFREALGPAAPLLDSIATGATITGGALMSKLVPALLAAVGPAGALAAALGGILLFMRGGGEAEARGMKPMAETMTKAARLGLAEPVPLVRAVGPRPIPVPAELVPTQMVQNITVNIDRPEVRSEEEARKLAEEVAQKVRRAISGAP